MYSSMVTSRRDSKAMSCSWPSQTSSAVRWKDLNKSGSALSGASSKASHAITWSASPDRMAVLSFHFSCTVGMPLLKGASSMMSSCIKVKL